MAKARSRLGDPEAPASDYTRRQSPIRMFGMDLKRTRIPSEEIANRLEAMADPFRAALSILWPDTYGDDGKPVSYAGFAGLSPFLQYPLELVQHHDSQGWSINRDRIVDERPFSAAFYGGLLGGGYEDEKGRQRTDWRMIHLLGKLPGSRWLSSIDKAMRQDRGVAEKAAGLLAGLTISDVDEEKWAEGQRKKILRELRKQKKEDAAAYQLLLSRIMEIER